MILLRKTRKTDIIITLRLILMYVILQATAGPYNGKKFKVLLKGPKYECYLGRTITGGIHRIKIVIICRWF